jgi:hypothetical protein
MAAQNTVPFTGGVYFHGTTVQATSGYDALERFWPTRATSYYTGFEDTAQYFAFRPTDYQLYYLAAFTGLHIDDSPTKVDTLVPTPPCTDAAGVNSVDFVQRSLGFNGTGGLYYECNGHFMRDGVEVGNGFGVIGGVLADGRVITVDAVTSNYVVKSERGDTVSLLAPEPSDLLFPLVAGTTVQGNDGFVLYTRDEKEYVVYRVDAQSQWLFVRRVTARYSGTAFQALSDGTILVLDYEAASPDTLIRAFLPDGSERVVWREADSPVVHEHGGPQLFVGPLEAHGPSVVAE